MRLKDILILTICFGSCKQDIPSVTFFKTQDLIVSDTIGEANQFLSFEDHSDYPIYYIGAMNDTIKIGKRYLPGRTKWASNSEGPCSHYFKKKLLIFVDTAIETNAPVEYLSDDPKMVRDSTINYHSFLFLVKNISDSVVCLGQTFSLYYINREAKDRNGNWVKLDKQLVEFGVSGEPLIILEPDNIVISKVRRYSGSFATDFRLVYGNGNNIVYSNVFRDSIDERMLSKSFAEE